MTKTLKLLKSRKVEKKTKEETTMAEIYKNIKTGVKAELVEINEKSKQVTLKKLADGKPTSTLMGSFEKYWKKIDGDATTEKKPAKTAPKKEVEKPVEEPAKEVKKEEPKAEKTKKEKAEKPKKEKKSKEDKNKQALEYTAKAIKLIESKGFSAKTYSGMPTDVGVINKAGKRLFEIYFGNNKFSVYTKENRVPKKVTFKNVKNVFNASIQYEYTADFEKHLAEVLSWTLPDDNEPKNKAKKKSKKAETEEK